MPQRACLAILLSYLQFFSHILSKCPRNKGGHRYRLCAWLLLGILNHHADFCLISRNSLKVQCFSYPSVAASSAFLCCTKDEGSHACLFWILFHQVSLHPQLSDVPEKIMILWRTTFLLLLGWERYSLATFYILSGSRSILLVLTCYI